MTNRRAPSGIEGPILELSDATVVKDGAAVLDGVSLTIRAGEHTAIVGPNGAGKSTLVNLLTHEDRPLARASGADPIRLFGSGRWNVFDLRSRFGIVTAELHQRFVNGNSVGRITAREAVLSRFFTGHGFVFQPDVTPEMEDAADAALARMGVAHLGGATLDRMSTGEARRVLIARALVTSPEALLLDEPTTGLDLVMRHQFLESIREIQSIVLLRRGRVAWAGPKATTLTGANLTAVFGARILLTETAGFYAGAVEMSSHPLRFGN